MPAQPAPGTATLPPLPHWEQTPADLPAAIRQVKAALRARIAASGRTVEEVFAVIERAASRPRSRRSPPPASAARRSGRSSTTPTSRPARSRPGAGASCAGAAAWWSAGTSTATRPWAGTPTSSTTSSATGSSRTTAARATTSSAASAPSPRSTRSTGHRAQMQARQSDRMARGPGVPQQPVAHESDGVRWFDPDRDSLYPDRIRRRPPGADSAGLGTHLDPGTLDLWMTAGLPAGVPAPVRRHRRAVRPVGRRLPHRRTAVPRHHHVLGVPHLPGLDRAVGHGPRPGRAAHRPDPRGDGLPHAAPAAARRARRRHVRRHRQPGLPGQPTSGTPCCCRRSPASPTCGPATPCGGTAT